MFGSRNQAKDHGLRTVQRSCVPDLNGLRLFYGFIGSLVLIGFTCSAITFGTVMCLRIFFKKISFIVVLAVVLRLR